MLAHSHVGILTSPRSFPSLPHCLMAVTWAPCISGDLGGCEPPLQLDIRSVLCAKSALARQVVGELVGFADAIYSGCVFSGYVGIMKGRDKWREWWLIECAVGNFGFRGLSVMEVGKLKGVFGRPLFEIIIVTKHVLKQIMF